MTDEYPPGMPEEVREYYRKQKNEHMAHVQDNTHAVKMFLDELSNDDLTALDLLLYNCQIQPEYNIAYFRGQITQLKHIKFGECPCGGEHDPAQLLSAPKVKRPATPDYDNAPREIEDVDLPDIDDQSEPDGPDYDADLLKDYVTMPNQEVVEVGSEKWFTLLNDYNMREVIEPVSGARQFECIGCGKYYPSLQDRALKARGPVGCDGCMHQEKWG